MFLNLVDYQTQHNLSIANPRHYFRWLKDLAKIKPEECTIAMMAQNLFRITANLEMGTQKGTPCNQYDVLEFILKRIPAEYFPKPRLSTASQLILLPSKTQLPLPTESKVAFVT